MASNPFLLESTVRLPPQGPHRNLAVQVGTGGRRCFAITVRPTSPFSGKRVSVVPTQGELRATAPGSTATCPSGLSRSALDTNQVSAT